MNMKGPACYVFIGWVFIALRSTNAQKANLSCSQHCLCYLDQKERVAAKCDIRGLDRLAIKRIHLPTNLAALDLSSNELDEVPKFFLQGFYNISYLSLANNSITWLSVEAFTRLHRLQTLDISYTTIKSTGRSLDQAFVNLENLLVENSSFAEPMNWNVFLELPRIQFISGVSWSHPCSKCNVTKTKKITKPLKLCSNCSEVVMSYSKGSTFDEDKGKICLLNQESRQSPSAYLNPDFTLQCICKIRDCVTEIRLHSGALKTRRLQRALELLHPLSSLALVLNLIVVVVLSSSKPIRRSPTLLLILNMAVCDLLLALFCMLSAIFNIFPDSNRNVLAYTHTGVLQDLDSFLLMCPFVTFIFSVAQFLSVLTSVFLTVEKYLAIVYCMKPSVRMTKKITVICLLVSWSVVIFYNICIAIFTQDEERKKILEGKTLLCSATSHSVGEIIVPQVLSYTFILVYLSTIPLYIRMYVVVRRSSSQMGVKREGSLARKLLLLIATNLVFSAVPNTQLPLLGSQLELEEFSGVFRSQKSLSIYVVWSPFFLLCVNACLNPFLFAFRHHLVKNRLRHLFRQSIQCCRKKQASDAISQPRRANVVHHSNKGFEIQETPL